MKIKLQLMKGMPKVMVGGVEYTIIPVWMEGVRSYGYVAASCGEHRFHCRISEIFSSGEDLSAALQNGFPAASAVGDRSEDIISALLDQGIAELVARPQPQRDPWAGAW